MSNKCLPLNNSQMRKIQRQVAKVVDQRVHEFKLAYILKDEKGEVAGHGEFARRMTRAEYKQKAGELTNGSIRAYDMEEGDFEFELGPFHQILEVPKDFQGTMSYSY